MTKLALRIGNCSLELSIGYVHGTPTMNIQAVVILIRSNNATVQPGLETSEPSANLGSKRANVSLWH
jgi:hypothetical protein